MMIKFALFSSSCSLVIAPRVLASYVIFHPQILVVVVEALIDAFWLLLHAFALKLWLLGHDFFFLAFKIWEISQLHIPFDPASSVKYSIFRYAITLLRLRFWCKYPKGDHLDNSTFYIIEYNLLPTSCMIADTYTSSLPLRVMEWWINTFCFLIANDNLIKKREEYNRRSNPTSPLTPNNKTHHV